MKLSSSNLLDIAYNIALSFKTAARPPSELPMESDPRIPGREIPTGKPRAKVWAGPGPAREEKEKPTDAIIEADEKLRESGFFEVKEVIVRCGGCGIRNVYKSYNQIPLRDRKAAEDGLKCDECEQSARTQARIESEFLPTSPKPIPLLYAKVDIAYSYSIPLDLKEFNGSNVFEKACAALADRWVEKIGENTPCNPNYIKVIYGAVKDNYLQGKSETEFSKTFKENLALEGIGYKEDSTSSTPPDDRYKSLDDLVSFYRDNDISNIPVAVVNAAIKKPTIITKLIEWANSKPGKPRYTNPDDSVLQGLLIEFLKGEGLSVPKGIEDIGSQLDECLDILKSILPSWDLGSLRTYVNTNFASDIDKGNYPDIRDIVESVLRKYPRIVSQAAGIKEEFVPRSIDYVVLNTKSSDNLGGKYDTLLEAFQDLFTNPALEKDRIRLGLVSGNFNIDAITRLVKNAKISVADDDVREFIADSGLSSKSSSQIADAYISNRLNISKDNALHQDLKSTSLDILNRMMTELELNTFLKGGALDPKIGYKTLKGLFSSISEKYEDAKKAFDEDIFDDDVSTFVENGLL